jgi:N-acetylglucosamine-6-phosphate deacetylase
MTRKLGVSAALVDGALVPGDVSLDGDVVAAVGLPPAPGGRIAAPGLVDLQVNGFAGVDLMAAEVDQMLALAADLPTYGVTAFLPTLITAAAADTDRALDRLTEAFRGSSPGAARSLGVHLEGPYLSPRRLGTHPAEHRRDPDPDELAAWRRRADVVAVTIAPELPGAVALVKSLATEGVLVSLGHSDATAHEAGLAFDAGARTVTHLFNAMRASTSRDPGIAYAALARADVAVQLIVDGHHLAPETVTVAWRAAGGRLALVTDAVAAAAAGDGEFMVGSVRVRAEGGVVRGEDGRLAGSALTMVDAVRNLHALGASLEDALAAASSVPARIAGRPDLGRLAPGAPADVVVLDDRLEILRVLVDGAVHVAAA